MDIKADALRLARLAMAGCILAVILATVSAFQGLWLVAAVNSVLFIALASLVVRNYRLAELL
jgi:hypothetical protein